MQHFRFSVAEGDVLKTDVTALGTLFVPLHFWFAHQAQDTSACDREVAELRKVGQCRSQWIEHTRTDDQKHDESQQGKFAAYQQIGTAEDHQCQSCPDKRDGQ